MTRKAHVQNAPKYIHPERVSAWRTTELCSSDLKQFTASKGERMLSDMTITAGADDRKYTQAHNAADTLIRSEDSGEAIPAAVVWNSSMLGKLKSLSVSLAEEPRLPTELWQWIQFGGQVVRDFWDRHPELRNTEWVECDYSEVAAALIGLQVNHPARQKSFLEWGCGFGVVAGTASLLGFDAVGIEAERFLIEEAVRIAAKYGNEGVEFWEGNFLPAGAEQFAAEEDPCVALKAEAESAYAKYGREITEFATIFAYPWPGEEHFLKSVFRNYAAAGARLVLYRGPFQVEFYEKLPTESR